MLDAADAERIQILHREAENAMRTVPLLVLKNKNDIETKNDIFIIMPIGSNSRYNKYAAF